MIASNNFWKHYNKESNHWYVYENIYFCCVMGRWEFYICNLDNTIKFINSKKVKGYGKAIVHAKKLNEKLFGIN